MAGVEQKPILIFPVVGPLSAHIEGGAASSLRAAMGAKFRACFEEVSAAPNRATGAARLRQALAVGDGTGPGKGKPAMLAQAVPITPHATLRFADRDETVSRARMIGEGLGCNFDGSINADGADAMQNQCSAMRNPGEAARLQRGCAGRWLGDAPRYARTTHLSASDDTGVRTLARTRFGERIKAWEAA